MKRELAAMKTSLSEIRSVMTATTERMMVVLVRIDEKVTSHDGRLARLETSVDRLHDQMDSMAKHAYDMRFRYAVHADTLLEHDRRIKKLEARGS